MFKNVASQKIAVFAFDVTTGLGKSGDAANITAYVSKDWGAVTVLGDTSATEMDATNAKGWYLFDVTQTEVNADALLFTGKSSTANISIVGQLIYTLPASFTSFTAPLDAAGVRSAVGLASANLDTQLTTIDDFLDTEIAAIKAKTDNLPAAPAAVGDIPTANQNADALLDRSNGVETGVTPRALLRLAGAVLGGKLSGAGSGTETFRNTVADSKNRVVATVDSSGNRTAITTDLT